MCITTSAVQRHQSAERSILRHIYSLVYPKIRRRRVMFFIQVVHGRPGGRLQVPGGGLKMAWLASAFAFIRARRPKKVRRRDLVMDESGGWLVVLRVSAFPTTACQRMSRILRIGTIGPVHQYAVYQPVIVAFARTFAVRSRK